MAQDIWYSVTGIHWPTHSNICWYSKYDVLETLSRYFPDMLTAVINVVDQGLLPKNAASLLKMLLDNTKCRYLKLELSAYVEVLFDLATCVILLRVMGQTCHSRQVSI